MSSLVQATEILQYYFEKAWEANGLQWGPDNNAEIEKAVEAIAESAVADAMAYAKEKGL